MFKKQQNDTKRSCAKFKLLPSPYLVTTKLSTHVMSLSLGTVVHTVSELPSPVPILVLFKMVENLCCAQGAPLVLRIVLRVPMGLKLDVGNFQSSFLP